MIEEHLDTFRKSFPYFRVMVYDDSLVYKIPCVFCPEVAKEANELIDKLNLPLIANTNGIFFNSIIIKPKN